MKKLSILIAILLFFSFSYVFGREGVEIDYYPVKILKGNKELPLELTLSNFSGVPVTEVVVNYRFSGEGRFRTTRMKNEGIKYFASLNVGKGESNVVEYYFNIRYMDGGDEAYPAGAPISNLLRTAIQQVRDYGESIVVISPEPEEQIYATDIVITASFTRLSEMVDPEKTRLYLGNWEISRYAVKYGDFVSFAPRKVPVGRHKIRLELYDSNSNLVATREWYFTAIPSRSFAGTEAGLTLSGRFYAESRRENLQDGASVQDYNQSALQLRGGYQNFDFGARIYLSNQEKSDRQPVNRYSGFARLNFWNNRYINAAFGDAYPKFNPQILQNVSVRGFHGTVFLKFVNLDVAMGQTYRAIEGLTHTETDTLSGTPKTVIDRYGTYRRKITAIRPSFGAGKNFQLGFTYLKGRDDTTSIHYGRNPEENAAFGADLFLGLDNQRILFEGDFNISAYNRNISGGSIPFDTLKSIMGDTTLDDKFYNLAKKFITINQYLIPRPGMAYQARARFRYFYNNLSLMYESVDEDYYSLGQPFLLRDNRGYHIVDNINLLRNQLFLTLGYRHYRNNLQNIKSHTTTNKNIYVNVSYFPAANLPEITVGYNNYSRSNGVPEDSLNSLLNRPEDNQTTTLNFSTGYRFQMLNLQHRFGLNLMNYRRSDIFKYAESNSNYFALNLRTQFNSPLQTQLEFVLQQTETGKGTDQESNLDLVTYGAGVQYTFKDVFTRDRLFLKARIRIGNLSSEYKISSLIYKYTRSYFSVQVNYSLQQYGNIGLTGDLLTYSGDKNYKDFIYSIRYDYGF